MAGAYLSGKRLLVVEDDAVVAFDLAFRLEERGAVVLGPVGRLEAALDVSRSAPLDGALLDVNLGGVFVYPLADELVERSVPFVFVTAYSADQLPQRFADTPKLRKPFSDSEGDRLMRPLFGRERT